MITRFVYEHMTLLYKESLPKRFWIVCEESNNRMEKIKKAGCIRELWDICLICTVSHIIIRELRNKCEFYFWFYVRCAFFLICFLQHPLQIVFSFLKKSNWGSQTIFTYSIYMYEECIHFWFLVDYVFEMFCTVFNYFWFQDLFTYLW